MELYQHKVHSCETDKMKLYQHKVHYYETDKMGIVHHSNYIRWMEEARIFFLDQVGWSFKKLEEMGVVSPVTAVECKYKVSTFFDEIITISVWVEEFKGVRLKLGYAMKKEDGTLACEGFSEHCFMNLDGKLISLKREYPELFQCLASLAEKN